MDLATMERASDSGWAMIIGTVDADGRPWAGRVWAVRSEDDEIVRVAVDAHDRGMLACLFSGTGVAVTAGDVRTLESTQIKGRSEGLEPVRPADVAAVDRNVERLLAEIEATDGLPRSVSSRFVPGEYVICRVRCTELFDQTPGPGAGTRVSGGT